MSGVISFIWPFMLVFLVCVPLSVWFYRRLRRRQRIAVAELGPLGLVQNRSGQELGRRRHIPPLLFLAGLTLLLIALARPEMTVALPRIRGTVVLAFDVSNSMAADDLEPTRMEAAKIAARNFVENQPGSISIGVVAFSTGGLVVQEPTHDRTAILSAIQRLSPQGGTSLGQGIFTSLNAIAGETIAIAEAAVDVESGTIDAEKLQLDDYSSAVILLLTDGENTGTPDPLQIAQVAAEAGVRVFSIGIGSADGTLLEIDGFNLVTQLDEATLQEIAGVTNGVYYRAENEEALAEIYEDVDLQLTVDAEKMEATALFAGAGLLFLLAGGACAMFWFGRIP